MRAAPRRAADPAQSSSQSADPSAPGALSLWGLCLACPSPHLGERWNAVVKASVALASTPIAFGPDNIKELRKEAKREGLDGISPRYIQDKLSNSIVSAQQMNKGSVNPFMVLNELDAGLKHHSLRFAQPSA